MTYHVKVSRAAGKELGRLSKPIQRRLQKKIDALADEPRPSGCRKLSGESNRWRVRAGDYRIVYSIEDDVLIVEVVRIRHRRDVYD